MHKQYEDEPRRIERADDATITFTIALHGPHAWEMVLEDSRRYHSISHGWATNDPHGWEDAIAPVLRQFFGKALTPRRAALKVLGEHAAVLHLAKLHKFTPLRHETVMTIQFSKQPIAVLSEGLRKMRSGLVADSFVPGTIPARSASAGGSSTSMTLNYRRASA